MAGLPSRPTLNDAYIDERRRPSDAYRPHQDARRTADKSRERDSSSRRESRDGPVRRDSRDMRDPRDAREDSARGAQDSSRRPSVASSSSPRLGKASVVQTPDSLSRSSNAAPSRLVTAAKPCMLSSKPPMIETPEYQDLFNTFWAWSDTLVDRVSVKSQFSRWNAEAGPRRAFNTKLEKADEGTSMALLRRTELRQQEKDEKLLKNKVSETDKSHQKGLEELISKFVALKKPPPIAASASERHCDTNQALERKLELLQSRFEQQEAAFAAREHKLIEQERSVGAWQKEMQDQHDATLKAVETLRMENENLKKQLTRQMREVSEKSEKLSAKTSTECDGFKKDLKRIDDDSRARCSTIEALCQQTAKTLSQSVDTLSQSSAQASSMITSMEAALNKQAREYDSLGTQIQQVRDSCANLASTIKSLEAEMENTTEKVDSLDLESLDKMVNTWVDNKIPGRVKGHEAEINNMRKELSALKDHLPVRHASSATHLPNQSTSVSPDYLDAKLVELYGKVQTTVAETSDWLGDELDGLRNDFQKLRDEKLAERIASLEARSLEKSSDAAATSALASRLQDLEGQDLPGKVNSLQTICMARLGELEKSVKEWSTQVQERASQVLREDFQAVKDKLEGVAMQANHLDTQFKNVTTKEMARMILGELNQVTNKPDSLGRRAIEAVEKLSSRLDTMSTEITQAKQTHTHMQDEFTKLSDFVDIVVRSGHRAGDKRSAEPRANGADSPVDPKRPRISSSTPSNNRPSPSVPQGMTNGVPRRPH
ncbi:uncharacterized protein B0I36DRAFT_357552 [Microdochium trichocladiopsis]|uniref:Uncharacterized protein n=1 Tax=Microdochium trichocladiopsis TaxID=1682393 RepID=A0A9P8YIY5_9PEZI|nr:uncharacterized protein B0I36DRAFT_357552 [Microdochium trichocladiopsis]KAH7040216.1 hypothetical protein B0I36DRAFT_357552 [Microdochium trichocladiopsis]